MSARLELDEADVQEEFFARGWTDGLPIVPPTPERVHRDARRLSTRTRCSGPCPRAT